MGHFDSSTPQNKASNRFQSLGDTSERRAASKIPAEIISQQESGVILVWRASQAVMPASYDRPLERYAVAVEFLKQQPRKLRCKGKVVAGRNHQPTPLVPHQFAYVGIGADGQPGLSDIIASDGRLEPAAHVGRSQSFPYDIPEVARNMIVHANANTSFVNECEEGNARTETRSNNTDPVITLRLQPMDCRSCIEHRLTICLKRAAQICAHHVVGALKSRQHSSVLIGQAQTQRGNPGAVQ